MSSVTLLLAAMNLLGGAEPALPDLKCSSAIQLPGYDAGTPIVVADGAIGSSGLGLDDIYTVQVHCWNPATLEQVEHDEPGLLVIVLTSHEGAAPGQSAIESFGRALDGFRAATSEDPVDAAALVPFGLDRSRALEISTLAGERSVVFREGAVSCTAAIHPRGLGEVSCAPDLDTAREVVRAHVTERTSATR